MRRTLESPELAERAASDAAQAASRAGVEVVDLHEVDDLAAASALFVEVWGTDDAQLSAELLRAMTHAGNFAAGACADGALVGAVAGFLGRDAGGTYLHSHILAVSAARRGRNIGFALKQHQRAWAIARDMDKITWTFDPLVRRNAFFNIQKLGADASAYHEQFYGSMNDSVNAGDESDRFLVTWHLDAPKASEGRPDVDIDAVRASDAVVVLDEDAEPNGDRGSVLLCATPTDVLDLRRTDPRLAFRWRRGLRATLGAAMHDGYVVSGFTRDGWYVLAKDGRGERNA